MKVVITLLLFILSTYAHVNTQIDFNTQDVPFETNDRYLEFFDKLIFGDSNIHRFYSEESNEEGILDPFFAETTDSMTTVEEDSLYDDEDDDAVLAFLDLLGSGEFNRQHALDIMLSLMDKRTNDNDDDEEEEDDLEEREQDVTVMLFEQEMSPVSGMLGDHAFMKALEDMMISNGKHLRPVGDEKEEVEGDQALSYAFYA